MSDRCDADVALNGQRSLINNIFKMQDSMTQMNSSLHCAINTVDKQMAGTPLPQQSLLFPKSRSTDILIPCLSDVARLEGLWQQEHQRYTVCKRTPLLERGGDLLAEMCACAWAEYLYGSGSVTSSV